MGLKENDKLNSNIGLNSFMYFRNEDEFQDAISYGVPLRHIPRAMTLKSTNPRKLFKGRTFGIINPIFSIQWALKLSVK